MSEEEILSTVRDALSEKFPQAEIVTYDEEPYITVIDDDITFDVSVRLGETFSSQ